jgi:putative Mg2+ transporter-C (MgtC) family protein
MNVLVDDLFHRPDMAQLGHVLVRVVVAAALGGLLGAERELAGKAAGLRTHMLVALGAALFVLFPAEAGMSTSDLSRVIQGVATGIGFIGAGTILKRAESDEIQGLTTAASIWLTAAIGMAVGAGQLWLPVICAVTAWVILFVISRVTPAKPATPTPDVAANTARPAAQAAVDEES